MIQKFLIKVLILILTHIFANRLISIPVAIALFVKWYIAVIFIFIMDLAQVPLYYYVYESPTKIKFIVVRIRLWRMKINRLYRKYKKGKIIKEERQWRATLLRRAQTLGQWGIIFITAVPTLGGGIWSGVLLAHLLRLRKRKSYLLLACGSLISCTILALGFGGIKALIINLLH